MSLNTFLSKSLRGAFLLALWGFSLEFTVISPSQAMDDDEAPYNSWFTPDIDWSLFSSLSDEDEQNTTEHSGEKRGRKNSDSSDSEPAAKRQKIADEGFVAVSPKAGLPISSHQEASFTDPEVSQQAHSTLFPNPSSSASYSHGGGTGISANIWPANAPFYNTMSTTTPTLNTSWETQPMVGAAAPLPLKKQNEGKSGPLTDDQLVDIQVLLAEGFSSPFIGKAVKCGKRTIISYSKKPGMQSAPVLITVVHVKNIRELHQQLANNSNGNKSKTDRFKEELLKGTPPESIAHILDLKGQEVCQHKRNFGLAGVPPATIIKISNLIRPEKSDEEIYNTQTIQKINSNIQKEVERWEKAQQQFGIAQRKQEEEKALEKARQIQKQKGIMKIWEEERRNRGEEMRKNCEEEEEERKEEMEKRYGEKVKEWEEKMKGKWKIEKNKSDKKKEYLIILTAEGFGRRAANREAGYQGNPSKKVHAEHSPAPITVELVNKIAHLKQEVSQKRKSHTLEEEIKRRLIRGRTCPNIADTLKISGLFVCLYKKEIGLKGLKAEEIKIITDLLPEGETITDTLVATIQETINKSRNIPLTPHASTPLPLPYIAPHAPPPLNQGYTYNPGLSLGIIPQAPSMPYEGTQ